MRHFFKRITPNPNTLQKNRILRPVAHLIGDPKLWHLHRRTVAKAVGVGVGMGFMPVPFQMLFAAAIAIFLRVNLPIAVTCTLVSNPISIPPLYYANYRFGCFLLDIPANWPEFEFSLTFLRQLGGDILVPLYFGSLILGLTFGALSFVLMNYYWRYTTVKQYQRRQRTLHCKQNNQANDNIADND